MIKLSIYYEDGLVKEFESGSSTQDITIGRAQGCLVQLDEPSISRLHALIRYSGGQWLLERKASFGAVLLNGQEVENAPLEGGEEISVGKFSIRVNIDSSNAQFEVSKPSFNSASFSDDGDGRTKFVSSGVNALFRLEPGAANVAEFLMDGDVVVFGRGSNCDVVLTEKKGSRKHFEVRRQGLSFFLKDLNSANGTLVNGQKVTEVELVPGDVIQVGEAKIQFSVENKDFFAKQDQFMPVPAHLQEPAAVDSAHFPASYQSYDTNGMASDPSGGMAGAAAGAPAEPEPKDLLGKLKKRWFSIPYAQRMRYLTIVVVGLMVMALLGNPDGEDKPKRPPPKKDASGRIIRTIDQLTPSKRKFVLDTYAELLNAHEKKEYLKMKELASKILAYVDDYKDTKAYESLANKGLEAIAEEKRRRELEEKQAALRREVQELENKGRAVFERALEDAKFRPELDSVIQNIYAKDPNNRLAGDWKAKIREKEEEEKQLAEAARIKEEQRQKAEAAFAEVEKIFKDGEYVKALEGTDKLEELGYEEEEYIDRIEKLRNDIRAKLDSVISPFLKKASEERGEGGDLVKAKEAYLEVLKIDSRNKEAIAGLDAIREVLHLRAKRLYAEAVLAESVSDLTEAKEKFEKCLRTAPDDDLYKRRCRSKLSRFDLFGIGGSGTSGGF